jgi:hypothetical protein
MQMKALLLAVLAMVVLLPGARADDKREEWREHPRIVKAVHDLEDAIKYMEAAPHDFGGHKAAAISASREAVRQLRDAINYREREEHH